MEIKDILDYVTGTPRNNNINVLKTMLETLTKENSIDKIGSVRVEDILKYVELTPHNSNVNVLKTMLESLVSPGPVVEDEAYAVFDSADGSLVFFRDEPGKYSEGQVIDTKTYYTGVETKTSGFGWTSYNDLVTNVRFDDEIKPISTLGWFNSSSNLISIIDLHKLNTSKVTNMESMFRNCQALTSLDVSNFDTSNTTNMDSMFYYCSALTSLDVSGFDTSNVTNMKSMFSVCQTLTSLDVSSFNFSNVTTMESMFTGCESLTTNITINDITKYTAHIFYNAAINPPAKITLYGEGEVTSDDIDGFIVEIKTDSPDSNIVNGMQTNTEAYAVFDSADNSLTFFRDDKDKYTQGQTEGTKTYYIDIETMQASSSSNVPWNSQRSNIQTVIFQDTISPVSTAYWFFQMSQVDTITDIEKLDTSKVTNMQSMFNGCSSLTTLDISHFDTSKVTTMSAMFFNCSSLTTLDVSHFNTSSVTNMDGMFYNCLSLTSLDVSHFDTSKVMDMGSMFDDCSSLATLDVSHFDTSKVTTMSDMFHNCQVLTATFNIMKMPRSYGEMCRNAATAAGSQITLKYISPVTSANIDTLVATKSSDGNVVNGGEGTFVPPTPPAQ